MNTTLRAIAVGIGAAALQLLMLVAFAWPAANLEPRDLPIAVTGPQAAMVTERLTANAPEAFAVTTLPDADAARAAIGNREVYGAIVTGEGAPRLLVASAASPAVAQQLTAMAQQLSGAAGAPVEDVVAADSDDPRGVVFGSMVLPLVMSGIAAGALLTLVVTGVGARLIGLVAFAVTGGLASMLLAQGWLSALPGSYLALVGVVALASFGVAGVIVGLAALIGPPGIGVGALTMLLIGNPFSAATSAPELLPQPWGSVGQLLPPGAAGSLLRSVAFFDGAGGTRPLVVLLVWAGAGLVLLGLAALRERRAGSIDARPPKQELAAAV